jgi:hypothetical protein
MSVHGHEQFLAGGQPVGIYGPNREETAKMMEAAKGSA